MTIAGASVNCVLPPDKTGTLYVYSKAGDYYDGGAWHSKNQWTKVVEKTVSCIEGSPAYAAFTTLVHMGKDSTQAFNIYVLTDDINADYPTTYMGHAPGGRYTTVTEDSYLQIQTGSGNFCSSGWCAIGTPTAFSGTLDYVVVDDSPTLSPTESSMPTTPFPTKSPTTSPTLRPTDNPTTAEPTLDPVTESPTTSPSHSPTDGVSNIYLCNT